jgi:16S rRNA (adenine1518-N6/adenine1519-N6)-dimethyltransferase
MGNPQVHKARKRFGQNFLHDASIIQKIVDAIAPQNGDHLVEIGPGQAALTIPLLQATGVIDAVELDRDLLAVLEEKCAAYGNINLHNADALKFDFAGLKTDERQLRLIGNLPYNISTPILFHLLEQRAAIKDMHFMLQKEVVDRMAANPGSKTYGRLSVMLQAYCSVEQLFDIGPSAFKPAPKVDSSIVRLVPYANSNTNNEQNFAKIVTCSFAQRRKTLRNNLKRLLSEDQIKQAGIDPGTRAETLHVADFQRLSIMVATH